MSHQLHNSLARILTTDGVPVGVGFLAAENLILTCAHVIEQAIGQEENAHFDFPLLAPGEMLSGRISFRNDEQDIACIKVENLPHDAAPVRLVQSEELWGHNFRAFGVPSGHDGGVWASGVLRDQNAQGWLHIEDVKTTGFAVQLGFSGGPVWDESLQAVVGMVVAAERDPAIRAAFCIPTRDLVNVSSVLEAFVTLFCPYRSLDVFNEEDKHIFFGRERIIEKLLRSLKKEPRFLAVLGPSGSGKSSVVRAGLIPALKDGKISGSDNWHVITMRPGTQPFSQLEVFGLINPQSGLETSVKTWFLQNSEKRRLVIFIDQFEELLVSTPLDIRKYFVSAIAKLLDSSQAVTVILTLRDDFYSRFQQDATPLVSWLEESLVNIPPTLEKEELRAMIISPAKQMGVQFEKGLVNSIIADAIKIDRTQEFAKSAILPLLEFALTQLWEDRQENTLTHDAYGVIGGVGGGLSQWADKAYYSLNGDERKEAQRILVDLINIGDENQGIPNTKRIRNYHDIVTHNVSKKVAQDLIQTRLLVASRDVVLGENRIEIIHEALIYQWSRLIKWVEADKDFLRTYNQFVDDAKNWEKVNRDNSLLYRGSRLTRVRQQLEVRNVDLLTSIEQEFLNESTKQQNAEEEMKQAQASLEMLLIVFSEVSASLDLDKALMRTLELLSETIGAERGTVMLLNPEDNLLHYRAGYGGVERQKKEFTLKIGEGLAGWVIQSQEAVLINDLSKDERSGYLEVGSAIAAPLKVGEDSIGVLLVSNKKRDFFTSEQLRSISIIAGQVATAINNAMLYKLIREQAERLGSMLRSEQEEASRSQAILDAVADGVLVTDFENKISYLNASAEQILGINSEKITTQKLKDFSGLFGKAANIWHEIIREWSENPQAYQDGETYAEQLELEDGRIVLVHLAPVMLRGNDFLGTVSIFRDITHEVEVDRLKSEFVAMVSHQLRTPMASIHGYVDILLMDSDGALTDNQNRFLSNIQENVGRLNIMITDMLDFSRIESGRVTLKQQLIELDNVVEDIISKMSRRSQEEGKSKEILFKIMPDLPLVYGDVDRVRQIIFNLVENSYKYTPDDGEIFVKIHAVHNDRDVQVDVIDNGIGIAPDEQEKIFERFYRGKNPLVQTISGIGLGLPLTKQLVEMHQGYIWVESVGKPDEGSIFSFTLPTAKPPSIA